MVVDYLINNTQCRGQDGKRNKKRNVRREWDKKRKRSLATKARVYAKSPPEGGGVPKIFGLSVNVPREVTE